MHGLNPGENSLLEVQTPKINYSFDISLEDGKEEIKIYDTTRNNTRYYYLVFVIVGLGLINLFDEHKEKRQQENKSTT